MGALFKPLKIYKEEFIMIELSTLFREYILALRNHQINVNSKSGPGQWTTSVKTFWANQGTMQKYEIWANGIDYTGATIKGYEYIVDLAWMLHTKRTFQIQLALECE